MTESSNNIPHTVGEVLRYERERRRYTEEKIAEEIGIKAKYVTFLEEGLHDKLPAQVYVRGYIKRYAKILHVDSKQLLELYDRERKLFSKRNNEVVKDGADPTKKEKKFSFVLTSTMAKIATTVILVVGFIGYLWYQVSGLSAPPELTIVAPQGEEQTIQSNNITFVGNTTPDSELTINGQQIVLNSEGGFQEDIALQNGINIVTIEARNKLGKSRIVEKKIFVEKPN